MISVPDVFRISFFSINMIRLLCETKIQTNFQLNMYMKFQIYFEIF